MTGVWLSEADVVELLDIRGAIDALASGLREEAAGQAISMTKTHAFSEGATLHALGAAYVSAGVAGTKTWNHTPGGAAPLLVLFSARDGSVLAVIEAFALGQMRTAAASAVATDRLAPARARVLAMCGTGKQALPQAAAIAAVRDLQEIRVWSPDEGHRLAFARQVHEILGVPCVPCGTVAEATHPAHIVTLITRARVPFLRDSDLTPGTHLNAVGAITPERSEFEADLLDRARVVAVDSPDAARRLSSELRAWCGDDESRWSRLTPLSALAAGEGAPAERDADMGHGERLTVFKAMGTGVSDVALGLACWRLATRDGRGVPLPERRVVTPRLAPRATMQEPERGGQHD